MKGIEAFADVKRLIVIAAHADDLETMCGGTIAMLIARGVEVHSVNCTRGDIGTQDATTSRLTLIERRMDEAKAAADLLGIKQVYSLGLPDGELMPDLLLRQSVAMLYRLTGADTVFTFDPFWTGQIHPDHRAAGQAALDAFMPAKMPLYHPEQLKEEGVGLARIERIFLFASERQPDIYVDVENVYEQKVAAALAHVSQFPEGEKNLEWMKAIDRRRGQVIDVAYAEAFKQVGVW